MGSIYKQKGSRFWWIKFYQHSQVIRESTGSTDYEYAKTLLKQKEGLVAEGKPVVKNLEKVTLGEIVELYLNHHKINKNKEVVRATEISNHLTGFFGGNTKVIHITEDQVEAYIVHRQSQPGKNGQKIQNSTINRELGGLKQMFKLGLEMKKAGYVPRIPRLKENPPRSGYFELDEFLSLRGRLPDHVKVPATIGFFTGMRKGEILNLRWDQVKFDHDKQEGKIILESTQTKNKTSRTIFFNDDMYRVLALAKKMRDQKYPGCPWVCQRYGKQLKSLKKSWKTATEEVGLTGKVFHDLRRTGVRDMTTAGIDEVTAMQISGHKTRSVFNRYNITSEVRLKEAAEKRRAYHQSQKAAQAASMGIVAGIVEGSGGGSKGETASEVLEKIGAGNGI